jgi:hypothetical protein
VENTQGGQGKSGHRRLIPEGQPIALPARYTDCPPVIAHRRYTCDFTCVTHGELRRAEPPRQARRRPTFWPPADGVGRGHRGVGSLFPPRWRAWHPHVKQCRRYRVRHILRSVYFTYVSRQLVAPKSHVGRSPAGGLNSWPNSVLQRTRPPPHCPALSGYPLSATESSIDQPLQTT